MWQLATVQFLMLLLLLFVPGYFFLRIFWFSKRQSLAAAPVAISSLIALQGILWNKLDIGWEPLTVLPAYLVLACLSILIVLKRKGFLQRRSSNTGGQDYYRAPLPRSGYLHIRKLSTTTAILLPVLLFTAFIAISGPILSIDPNIPLQGWDPVFHANGIAVVEETKSASYFGSLTPLYGLETTSTNYAVTWHAIASLIASPDNIISTMNSFIVLMPALWITSVWGLIRSLGFDNRYVLAFLVLVPAMLVYPTYLTTLYAPIPNAFAVAILPGLLALIAITVREGTRDRSAKIFGLRILAIGIIVAGSLFVHPSMVTSVILLLIVPTVSLTIKYFRFATFCGRVTLLGSLGAAILLITGAIAFVPGARSRLVAQLSYETTPGLIWPAVINTLTAAPMIGSEAGALNRQAVTILQVGLLLVLVVGIVSLWYAKKHRWLIGVWVLAALLTFTTMARQGPLVPIAGLWYMSPHRAMALQQIPMSILIAVGLVACLNVVRKLVVTPVQKHALTVSLLIFLQLSVSGLAWGPRAFMVAKAWGYFDQSAAMVSEEEATMMYRLRDELPDDALVLGDPGVGAAFVQAISGSDVVFSQVYVRESNLDGNYLAKHFADINNDPHVCELVNELGITHYYADTLFFNLGQSTRERMPGLYYVPTNEGFREVDSGGSATVYEITACK